jgi:signal transduction histidine kinase/DNA-binding response OmpR family regulator
MFAVVFAAVANYGFGLILARRGKVDIAGIFISVSLSVILMLNMWTIGPFSDGVWFFTVPIFIASFAVRPNYIWLIGAFNIVLIALLYKRSLDYYGYADESFARMITSMILMVLMTAISFVQQYVSRGLFQEAIDSIKRIDLLRREAEEAQHAAELASQAKSTFLANMSHELRTPLNAIIGYSEILMEDTEEEETRGDLGRIHVAGQHLLALINDILDLSKIEAGRMAVYPERFDIKEFLEQLIATLKPMAQRNHDALVLVVEGELGVAYTDHTKLRQVLLNLLSNALKFTENGAVTLRAGRDAGVLRFRVEDTGIGMDEATLKRIFKPFVQADASTTRKYGGTGLGLSLTHKLLTLLGGDVSVTSEVGVGSRFEVTLPASYQSQRARGGAHDDEAPRSGGELGVDSSAASDAPLVLVVDDDEATRDYVARQLDREGFVVRTCSDGAQGVELARELRPSLILMDILMPEVDGWEMLSVLREDEELRDIPVILASILDERSAGMRAGAADFLTKPIQRERLIHSIRRALGANYPDDPDEQVHVLIVEDSQDSRELLVRMIQLEPSWVAHTAHNGADALDVLGRVKPHIILLDLMMPKMDGFSFLRELRADPARQHIPVLVVTAKTLEPDEERVLSEGTSGVLTKGQLERDNLVTRMRAALATP